MREKKWRSVFKVEALDDPSMMDSGCRHLLMNIKIQHPETSIQRRSQASEYIGKYLFHLCGYLASYGDEQKIVAKKSAKKQQLFVTQTVKLLWTSHQR